MNGGPNGDIQFIQALEARAITLIVGGSRSAEDALTDLSADMFVQLAALVCRGQRRAADRTCTRFRDAQPATPVTSQLFALHHIILRQVHANEVRKQVKHQ
jgi:hypothetical protein